MSNRDDSIETILANVLTEFAFEIDRHYEEEEITKLTSADSTFSTFRSAVQELRKRRAPLSDRVLHVERRIEAAAKAGEGST